MLYIFVGEYPIICIQMNSETTNQERQHFGLLGLDKLPTVVKIINLCISTVVGIALAYDSWISHFFRGMPSYISPPFLPLIFAWPVCGILLWLRLTGYIAYDPCHRR
jgi:hypothetical protein